MNDETRTDWCDFDFKPHCKKIEGFKIPLYNIQGTSPYLTWNRKVILLNKWEGICCDMLVLRRVGV